MSEDKNTKLKSNSDAVKTIDGPRYKILLEFKNINYLLKKGKKRHILKNCCGYAIPGRFLAILGTSGAGKSSLLNILSGRLRESKNYKVTGTIKLNGTSDCSKEAFQQNTAYVMQKDLVYETLKVYETIELSAKLRLSKKNKDKGKLVENIISVLGLKSCKNSIVGGKKIRGISGGERKRVCIGNELITNPSLFFIDEPTSGLDSYTAFKVTSVLVDLAKSGRTVIATLHQPSTEIFRMFDDLMLLSSGYIEYMGPAKYAIEAFSKMGYPIALNCNPADHFLDSIVQKSPEDIDRIKEISLKQKEIVEYINGGEFKHDVPEDKIIFKKIDTPNIFEQTYYLTFKRTLKNYYRNPATTYIRLAQTVIFSIICGCLFFNLEYTVADSKSKSGALFFIITNLTMNALFNVLLVFPLEKDVFLNELSNGMYSLISYIVSKIVIEIPMNLFIVLIYQVILYWMVGFRNNASSFWLMYLVLETTTLIGYFMGMFLSALAKSPDIAIGISTFILLPSFLFSGFFIKEEQMQVWLQWTIYANFFKYGMDMLLYIEFYGDDIKIEYCPTNANCEDFTGTQFLKNYKLDTLNFWGWFGILIGFAIFYFSLTVLVIALKTMKSVEAPLNNEKKKLKSISNDKSMAKIDDQIV